MLTFSWISFKVFCDFSGDFGHFFRCEGKVATEVDIGLGINGEEVYMGVGHFKAEHHLRHLAASEGATLCFGCLLYTSDAADD